ncbi:endoglucanase 3 precursor [Aspergillus terreus NIH2624]|uniref:cellulase n=1 Tax=Aspergillus terreus (strain NIH 2624 / FGSC A1156) TaxID=341663 RepID=Q0CRK7_ASPTN|nr:endoglucanase 3 precursor [Aspergillus terreus NIH2624]EAU35479.1 endoglucanase 3 precursor [Aspergillus terreus NIH2624]
MKLSAMLVAVAAGSAMAVPHHRKRASPFQWFGVNESGAEFGENNLPGVYVCPKPRRRLYDTNPRFCSKGTDYIWPEPSAISTLAKAGMNIFRVQFKMERLTPDGMTGAYNEDYLANLTAAPMPSLIPTTMDDFISLQADSQHVDPDAPDNEYNTMDQELVLNLNQAAIDGIRAAGATEQYIFVEGNQWSGAWSWVDVNDNMKALTDPQDKIIYEMHQYLDSDSSGTSETCVSGTIGQERVSSATQWLRSNGKKGIIGEFAGASNDVCRTAVTGMLNYLSNNTDVWTGAVWWAAGPWWADYMFNMEPPSGPAYTGMLDVVQPFMVA